MGRLPVRVTPRSSRDEMLGFDAEGTLRVKLTAPPVDGAANEALVRVKLSRSRSAVVLLPA
mgnify:CR=1 FL=1